MNWILRQIEGNYKDQFVGTLGYRIDKSTLNGDPNKFYGFPKASLAINLQNFDGWQSGTIDQFKIRQPMERLVHPLIWFYIYFLKPDFNRGRRFK